MKEKELYVDFKQQQAVYYVEKEDDSYGPVVSGSQLSHDYLDDFYLKKRNLELDLRHKIVHNEISPVYYFMLLQEMGEGDLASRTGVSKRRLRKHCTPKGFSRISVRILQKYADIFDIPLSSFFAMLMVKDEGNEKIEVERVKTLNPVFEMIKVKSKKK